MFSDDVFHIIFDNVLLKDSVQISRYFIKRSLASSSWHFPILLLYFDHRLMKVLLIILAGNMYRACLFGAQARVARSMVSANQR